jgi:ABC-type microcin C transport system permease subunit YejB
VPLVIKLFDYPIETLLCQLLLTLPKTIAECKHDNSRVDLLSKIDEVIGKAIDEKKIQILTYALKELEHIFESYGTPDSLNDFFESFSCFNQIQKRVHSLKVLTLMQSKDSKTFEVYLRLLRNTIEKVDSPS